MASDKTVRRAELSNLRMVAGGEKRRSKVIVEGVLKEWVGIGWITLRQATAHDKRTYPTAVD